MASKLFEMFYGRKKEEELEKYSNPYDDGSVWSKQEPIDSPLSRAYEKTSRFSYGGRFGEVYKEPVIQEDPLQAPRNQMQYYSNKLNELGVEPEKPSMLSRGLGAGLKALEGASLVPSTIDNAISGSTVPYLRERIKTEEVKDKAINDIEKNDDKLGKLAKILNKINKFINAGSVGGSFTAPDIVGASVADKTIDAETGTVRKKTDAELRESRNAVLHAPINAYKSAKGGIKGFFTNDYSDVASYSDLLPEDSSPWAKIGLDVGVGLITPGFGEVGSAVKYVNKANKVEEAFSATNDIKKAVDLAKASNTFDDYKKMFNSANPGVNASDDILKESYNNYIESIAKQNIKESGKAIGAMSDFEGIKFGNKTVLSREALRELSNSDSLKSKLTKAGLKVYSPVSAVLDSKIVNSTTGKILDTKAGQTVKEAFEKGFVNEYKIAMRKDPSMALEYGNAMVNSKKNKKMFKNSINTAIKEVQDYNNQSNQDPNKITKAVENAKVEYKEVQEPRVTLNDAYVQEAFETVNGDYYALSNNLKTKVKELEENIKSAEGQNLVELKNQKESYAKVINLIDEAKVKTDTNFTEYIKSKEVKELGLNVSKKKNNELLQEALKLDSQELADVLVSKYGVEKSKANYLAVQLRTNANSVLDNINEMLGEDVSKYFAGIKTKMTGRTFKDAELSRNITESQYIKNIREEKYMESTGVTAKSKNTPYTGIEYTKYRTAKAHMEANNLTEKHKELHEYIRQLLVDDTINLSKEERVYNIAKANAEKIKNSNDLKQWMINDIGVDFNDLSEEEWNRIKKNPVAFIKEQMSWLKKELKQNPIEYSKGVKTYTKIADYDAKEIYDKALSFGLTNNEMFDNTSYRNLVGLGIQDLDRNGKVDQIIMGEIMKKFDGYDEKKLKKLQDHYSKQIRANKKLKTLSAEEQKNQGVTIIKKGNLQYHEYQQEEVFDKKNIGHKYDISEPVDDTIKQKDFDVSGNSFDSKSNKGYDGTDYLEEMAIDRDGYISGEDIAKKMNYMLKNTAKKNRTPRYALQGASDDDLRAYMKKVSERNDLNLDVNNMSRESLEIMLYRFYDKKRYTKFVDNIIKHDPETLSKINKMFNTPKIKEAIKRNKDLLEKFDLKITEAPRWTTRKYEDFISIVNARENLISIKKYDKHLYNYLMVSTKGFKEVDSSLFKYIGDKAYELNKTNKKINLSLRNTGIDEFEKSLSTLEFNTPSGTLNIKEGLTDLKGITTDDLNGANVILGESLDSSIQGMQKGVNVYVNMDSDNARGVLYHEIGHILDEQNISAEKKVELYDNLVETMKRLPQSKRNKLIKLINEEGVDKTTASSIMKGHLTDYIAGKDINKQATETLATYTSLINSNDPLVRKQIIQILGERNYTDFVDSLGTISNKKANEVIEFTRKTLGQEKAELTKKIINIDKILTIDEQKATIHNIEKTITDMQNIIDDVYDVQTLTENNREFIKARKNLVKYFEKNNPEVAKEVSKTVDKYKTIYDIQYIAEKVHDVSKLTESELKTFNKYIERMKDIGIKEGILTPDTANLYSDYVTHMVSGDIDPSFNLTDFLNKMDFDVKDPTNVFSKERKIKGTIEDINKESERLIGKKIFEENIYKLWLNREIKHNKYMYTKRTQDNILRQFGLKVVTNLDEDKDIKIDEIKYQLNKLGVEIKDRGIDNSDIPSHSPYFDGNNFDPTKTGDNVVQYAKKTEEEKNRMLNTPTKREKGIWKKVYSKEKEKDIYVPEFISNSKDAKIPEGLKERFEENLNNGWTFEWKETFKHTEERPEYYLTLQRDSNEWLDWKYENQKQRVMSTVIPDKHKSVYNPAKDYYDYIYSGKLSEDGYMFIRKAPLEKSERGIVDVLSDPNNATMYSEVELSKIKDMSSETLYIIKKDAWDIYKKEMERIYKKDKNAFLKAYDKFSSVFKAQAVTSVKFHVNNEIGNFFNSYVGAGVNLYNPKMIKIAHDLKTNKPGKIGKYTYDEIRAYLSSSDMLSTQVDDLMDDIDYDSFIKSKIDSLTKQEKVSPLRKALSSINPLNADKNNGFIGYRLNYKVGESIETRAKLVNFVTHLQNGMNLGDAETLTKKVLFDYSDLTDFESNVLKRIAPFYSFMSKNLGLQFDNMQNKPTGLKTVNKLYQTSSRENETDKDRAIKPKYMDDYLPLGNQKYLNLRLPFFDIKTVFKPTDLASSLNPIIKSPIEMMLNKEFYSGNDISRQDKPVEKLSYGMKSLMPLAKKLETFVNLQKYSVDIPAYDKYKGDKEGRKKAIKGALSFLGDMRDGFDVDKAEKQTMYEYVTELQNQYYELLQENPELRAYLEQLEQQERIERANRKKPKNRFAGNSRFN